MQAHSITIIIEYVNPTEHTKQCLLRDLPVQKLLAGCAKLDKPSNIVYTIAPSASLLEDFCRIAPSTWRSQSSSMRAHMKARTGMLMSVYGMM